MESSVCGYSYKDKELAEKIIMHIRRETAQDFSYLEKGIFYLKPEPSENVKYLGASYSTLYYNPLGVIELYEKKPNKLKNAVIHAVLHCMLLHPSFDAKEDKIFDAAADAIVNAMIENSSPGGMKDFVNFLNTNNLSTVSQLYAAAVENKQIEKRLTALVEKHKLDDHCVWKINSEDAKNNSSKNGNNGCESNKKMLSEPSQARQSDAESDWSAMMNESKSCCSMQYGNSTGNMFMSISPPDRFSKFSYDEYIRRFTIEEILKEDPENIDMMLYSMSMDMYDDTPIVKWNEISECCNPSDLIIAIDMSGSCGGETASNFLRQIYSLFESMDIRGNVNIHIVFFDTRILKKCVIRNRKEADDFIKGYTAFGFGGTDFNCVFEYADNFENGSKKLKGLFFFSDACGFFPSEKKKYPTIFFVPDNNSFVVSNVPEWIELVHYND